LQANNPWVMLNFESYKMAEDDMAWLGHSNEFQECMDGYRNEMQDLSCVADIEEFVAKTSDAVMNLSMEDMFVKDNYGRFISRRKIGNGEDFVVGARNILACNKGDVVVNVSDKGDVELVYDLGNRI